MSHWQDGKTIKFLADRLISEFIRHEHPQFRNFVYRYFEYLDREKGEYDIIAKLFFYGDIDRTLDEFIDYFKPQYTTGFPDAVAADFRFLIKNIKSFYLSKGSEKSYEFLFKVLFDSFVEFYYPKNDILRASDGKWIEPNYLKIDDFGISFIDIVAYIDKKVVGDVSGATNFIEEFTTFEDLPANPGVFLPHYRLSTVGQGDFLPGENISIVDDTEGRPPIPVVEIVSGQGRWEGRDGFLSDKNKLQDNFFYQDFSYVIRSEVSINFWREIVEDILHPAGFKVFGEISLTDEDPKDSIIVSMETLITWLIERQGDMTLNDLSALDYMKLLIDSGDLYNTLTYGRNEYTYAWIEANKETARGEAILHAGNQMLDHAIIGDFVTRPNDQFEYTMAKIDFIPFP